MNWNEPPAPKYPPDFSQLLAVLERRPPDRPVLFEFFLNDRLYCHLVPELAEVHDTSERMLRVGLAFSRLGYDYVALYPPGFSFTDGVIQRPKEDSVSLNQGSLLHSASELRAFPWPDPSAADFSILQKVIASLPTGMKLIAYGAGGVLENVIELVGHENLCVMIKDDPGLAAQIFGEVGSRFEQYYQAAARLDYVGACISNDDWGFKTQTLFSPADMRRFVFPWHKRIVAAIHAAGKPAILHSCGHFERVIEDVIVDMGYDARHSYEDAIMPVEQAYERYGGRIAILGGIDVDFICRSDPAKVYQRSKAMLVRTVSRGSYALGTGNSVPEYVPDEGYFAMLHAAWD
jgi:uroporphyrinogen decarboxylase